MRKAKINPNVLRDPSWLHWATTVPLLAAHVSGVDGCLEVAIALCVVVAIGMWKQTRNVLAMPVQVRLAYAALLLIGTAPGMFWVYFVQLVGTTTMVLFGYCPLVRMLTLLPWNRSAPFTWIWLKRLVLSASPGGLVDWSERSPAVTACSCSCSLAPAHTKTGLHNPVVVNQSRVS